MPLYNTAARNSCCDARAAVPGSSRVYIATLFPSREPAADGYRYVCNMCAAVCGGGFLAILYIPIYICAMAIYEFVRCNVYIYRYIGMYICVDDEKDTVVKATLDRYRPRVVAMATFEFEFALTLYRYGLRDTVC